MTNTLTLTDVLVPGDATAVAPTNAILGMRLSDVALGTLIMGTQVEAQRGPMATPEAVTLQEDIDGNDDFI